MHLMKPALIGAGMALGMLFLMHDAIMSGTATVLSGAIAFVLLHVVVLVMLASLVLFVPSARRFARAHRPGPSHLVAMALGTSVAAGSAHVLMHGIV